MLNSKTILGIPTSSSLAKDQMSDYPNDLEAEKSEGNFLRVLFFYQQYETKKKSQLPVSVLLCCPCVAGLPQGVESQDSEQFFRKVLGVQDGSPLGSMKPILEANKAEPNPSLVPQRPLLSGV